MNSKRIVPSASDPSEEQARIIHLKSIRLHDPSLDLTVAIPALNEGANLALLLPQLNQVLQTIGLTYEILIITRQADRQTREEADRSHARVIEQTKDGYGGALLEAFQTASGKYVLTMDADLSHPPVFIRDMWSQPGSADLIVASRYITGGGARMPAIRYLLSRTLNAFFGLGLDLPTRDLSSGFRLYKSNVVRQLLPKARDFDVLPELLVRAYAEGWRTKEVPFLYAPRKHGSSHAWVFKFGLAYLRTFGALWRLRNSIQCADYDDRAHDSRIPLQRWWQRMRFRHLTELIRNEGPVLDVGCGSSRIIGALPPGSVALDPLIRKLRYARKFSRVLVEGSGFHLPFPDESFPCVLCSQVIEHVPKQSPILHELCRVLKPGGRLVLGTPDYANWEWVWTEKLYGWFAPGAYADEHISHYTRTELIQLFEARGFRLEDTRYILRGELILAFRKTS
jgi:dolichol-phosphate mannosyltransferase